MTNDDMEFATVQSLQILAKNGIRIVCKDKDITDKLKGDVE